MHSTPSDKDGLRMVMKLESPGGRRPLPAPMAELYPVPCLLCPGSRSFPAAAGPVLWPQSTQVPELTCLCSKRLPILTHRPGSLTADLNPVIQESRNVSQNHAPLSISWDSMMLKLRHDFKKIFIQFLKVTFHLQLLKNIGYIPQVEQNILGASLYLPLAHLCVIQVPFVITALFSMSVSLHLFCCICYF